MSFHEGITCSTCSKNNFTGKRYKCLVCDDYDLCSKCYEAGNKSKHHLPEHAVQCLLTRTYINLYFMGEIVNEQPQSFTCPYCGKFGFIPEILHEHVIKEHAESLLLVYCPVCTSLPGIHPSYLSENLALHLILEHRNPAKDSLNLQNESSREVRLNRFNAVNLPTRSRRLDVRLRHPNIPVNVTANSTTPRDNVDVVYDVLTHLPSEQRIEENTSGSVSHHQQLRSEIEIQMEHVKRQLDLIHVYKSNNDPRTELQLSNPPMNIQNERSTTKLKDNVPVDVGISMEFLLPKYINKKKPEVELIKTEQTLADRSLFVRQLFFSMLAEADDNK